MRASSMRLAVVADGRMLGGALPARRSRSFAVRPVDASASRSATTPRQPTRRIPPRTSSCERAAGITLTGTLTIPRGARTGRAPAVVTITGSGPEDRDEESAALKGLSSVSRARGHARSARNCRVASRRSRRERIGCRSATATSQDFADDIRAGVAFLRTRPEIDRARIALVGHSEGGIIAPHDCVDRSGARGDRAHGGLCVDRARDPAIGSNVRRRYMAHLTGDRRAAALAQASSGDRFARRVDAVVEVFSRL